MHSNYEIHQQQALIQVLYTGDITLAFILGRIELMKQDARFQASMDMVVDFSEATFAFDVNALQVDMVQGYKRLLGSVPGRTALIITNPKDTAYGMLFKTANPGREVEIFSTRTAAEGWVNSQASTGPA